MTPRLFADWYFEHLGRIEPKRGTSGDFLTFMPQDRYANAATSQRNAYGDGPFCQLHIARQRHEPGLYVLTSEEVAVYAGECADVGKRWGVTGYGGIAPKNCFVGGQPTNCRVNAAVLAEAQQGHQLDLWFAPMAVKRADRLACETHLIQSLKPLWNLAKKPR